MENISIEVSYHFNPEIATLRVKGFLYANTLPEFEKSFQTVLSASKKKLIFDLTETAYVSSGGWSLLIVCLQRLKEIGGDILLVGMKPEVHDSFELLEYDKVLRLYPNVEMALKEGFNHGSKTLSGITPLSHANTLS